MEECDTLLIAGSTFPYIEYYPKPGQANPVRREYPPRSAASVRQTCAPLQRLSD
jgi:hypothetical protein